jgi:hypothetical protein
MNEDTLKQTNIDKLPPDVQVQIMRGLLIDHAVFTNGDGSIVIVPSIRQHAEEGPDIDLDGYLIANGKISSIVSGDIEDDDIMYAEDMHEDEGFKRLHIDLRGMQKMGPGREGLTEI